MSEHSHIQDLEKEIEQLKKEAEYTQVGLKKTNEGIRVLYRELEKKNEELKKFAEAKSEFVSVVSHELRTPLTSIREGIHQVLEGLLGVTTQEQKEFLSMSLSDIDRLRRIVENLLDISRLEAERADIRREAVDIVDLVKGVKTTFLPQAKDLGLNIKTEFNKEHIELYVDRDKIIQVFINLIGNAFKFTQTGQIALSVLDRNDVIVCSVADTGFGIAKENLPLVFGKFQKFDQSALTKEKGTGLGLSICQGIVELHGGQIKVKSEVNKGTTFTFTLPKLSVEQIFQEYVRSGIKNASRQKGVLSIVVFHIQNAAQAFDNMDRARLSLMIEGLRKIAKTNLRRKADLSLEGKNSILMVLTQTEKKDALMLSARIQNSFFQYLTQENMDKVIDISQKVANFPEDGQTAKELLQKVDLAEGLREEKNIFDETIKTQETKSESSDDLQPISRLRQDKEERDMLLFELAKKDRKNKELLRELEGKTEEIRKLDQLKSDFISTVSHELRTPMTIIQEGVSQVLEEMHGGLNDEQKEYLHMSFEGIDRLRHVVNELLDISNLEAEKITLRRVMVSVTDLVRQVVKKYRLSCEEKGLQAKTQFSHDNIELFLDHERITQVFESLMDNALNFTEKGYIGISLEDKERALECQFEDTGRGIAEENLPKVFGKFEQFDRPYGPGGKGTGLGLSICKGIIELHGGHIKVESKLNEGTKFIFDLPRISVDQAFEEYVTNGIKEAIRFRESLSLIVFEIANFLTVEKTLGKEKTQDVLAHFNDIIRKSLRRKADLVLKSTDAILMMLPLTTKENAPLVAGRMIKDIEEYLASQGLGSKIQIIAKMVTFPDDGTTQKELMKKIGRL
ncbi:MAG: ATP-binding protein [Candidatus Omnitrophota bacterium]